MKILHLDIESSPNTAHVWGMFKQNVSLKQLQESSYTMCWAAKWHGEKDVKFGSLNEEPAENMLTSIWGLLDEADAIVHYNGCVTPGNRVLTKDLRWVDVASLRPGDELLAVEEWGSDGKPRKYQVSTVEVADPIKKECSTIHLSDGKRITASNDHPWLVRGTEKYRNFSYKKTEELEGKFLTKILPTWETRMDSVSGYLAAFLDGEGSLSQMQRKGRRDSVHFSISFSQNTGAVLDKLINTLEAGGYEYSVSTYDPSNTKCRCVTLNGGLGENLKFLGENRPAKLENLDYDKLESSKVMGKEDVTIDSIEPVGEQTVIGLQTSSRTYIVEGFPCHNSKFDIPTLNKEFLLYGFMPPSPYKQIDLLQTCRRKFRFPSNKLDYVSERLGLGGKKDHEGHELWVKCMAGDQKAWKKMEQYNKQDVKLLEKLYKRLLPWISGHPNWNLYSDSERPLCSNCGSHKVQSRGVEHLRTRSYRRFQCTSCGTWMHGTKTITDTEKASNILKG